MEVYPHPITGELWADIEVTRLGVQRAGSVAALLAAVCDNASWLESEQFAQLAASVSGFQQQLAADLTWRLRSAQG